MKVNCGIEVSSVNLTDVQVPDPVVPSQHDANKALADAEGFVKQVQAYAKAYAAHPDFYAFYRSLQAYERALGKDGDVLVLSPDSEFFRYFNGPGQSAGHSP
jgi:modulator of FtsH protease HflC